MIVPEYDQKVGVDDASVPAARVESVGPEASPASIYSAEAGIGKAVEEIGGDVAKYIVYQRKLAAKQDGYDRASKYAQGLDQALNGENGLLTKQRGNAVGILHGKDLPPGQQGPTDLDPNSYIGQERKLREQALAGLSGPEAASVARLIDSHNNVGFNAVLKHEAQQSKLAQVDAVNGLIAANANTFSMDPSAAASQKLLTEAQTARTTLSQRHGEDADTTAARGLAVGDTFAKAMVDRNIELRPDMARDTLEKMHSKGEISEDTYGVLKTKVDGKWLDMKKAAVADQVLKNPSNFNSDGTISFGAADEQAKKLVATLPAGEQSHVLDEVHKQAERQNSAVEQAKKASDLKFSNDVLAAQREGVPPETAYDSLIKKGDFMNATDRAQKEKLFQSIYTSDPTAMDKIMQTQRPDQKLAWDWVDKVAASKFGNKASVLPGDESSGIKTPLKEAFLAEMKRQYMGKSPAEIRAGVTEAVKDVVTEPGYFWDTTKPKWQITRDAHDLDLDKRAALISKHGELMTSVAEAYLKNNGKQARPEDINAAIELAKKAHGIP